jgi:hypothetical protein
MTIKVRYEVTVGEDEYPTIKLFDTLAEAKEYESTIALAEIICSCPTVYVPAYSAEELAAYLIKEVKGFNEATTDEVKSAVEEPTL